MAQSPKSGSVQVKKLTNRSSPYVLRSRPKPDITQRPKDVHIDPEAGSKQMAEVEYPRQIAELKTEIAKLKAMRLAQHTQISVLRRSLDIEKSMSRFTTFDSRSEPVKVSVHSSEPFFEKALQDIEPKVRQMPTLEHLLESSTPDKVKSVLQTQLRLHIASVPLERRTALLQCCIDVQSLVKFATWTMICEWVFGSSTFNEKFQESPVASAVIETLVQRDGSDTLHNLVLATCARCVDEKSPWFESVYEQVTSKLSHQFCDALIDILRALCHPRDGTNLSTIELSEEASHSLKEILKICVRLKTKLSLMGWYFEFRVPGPGTVFDPVFMDVDIASIARNTTQNPEILLCTRPAILAYRERIARRDLPHDTVSLGWLDDHFIRQDEGAGDMKQITNARVMLFKVPVGSMRGLTGGD